MDDMIGVILVIWIVFASAVTGWAGFSEDSTSKTSVIRLCDKVGQFQYDTTIVTCQVKKVQ